MVPMTYAGARGGMRLKGSQSRLLFGLFFLARTIYRGEEYGWAD